MAKKKLEQVVRKRAGRVLNILFNLHSSVPHQMSGAEVMAHRMAKYLVECGHKVTVLTAKPTNEFEGVKMVCRGEANNPTQEVLDIWQSADVVLTHLGQVGESQNKCRHFRKPIVHIIHNSFEDIFIRTRVDNSYVVYNSEWVKRELKYPQPSIILNPPVDYREFERVPASNRKHITLINTNENKGGRQLIEIAKLLPQYNFLAVEGGYYDQIRDLKVPNITYIPQARDIKEVLKQTKLLLVPSEYESWGLVAIEAMAAGIPVIANPTTGLIESMGGAGHLVRRNDIAAWCESIKQIMSDTKSYPILSEECKNRAVELDPILQLEHFEGFIQQISRNGYL